MKTMRSRVLALPLLATGLAATGGVAAFHGSTRIWPFLTVSPRWTTWRWRKVLAAQCSTVVWISIVSP